MVHLLGASLAVQAVLCRLLYLYLTYRTPLFLYFVGEDLSLNNVGVHRVRTGQNAVVYQNHHPQHIGAPHNYFQNEAGPLEHGRSYKNREENKQNNNSYCPEDLLALELPFAAVDGFIEFSNFGRAHSSIGRKYFKNLWMDGQLCIII